MSPKTYTLGADEKATQVMIGTADMLIWGDLVTKEHARVAVFLSTLAEDFVLLRDARMLFLAPSQQSAPIERAEVFVKFEEILLFYAMGDPPPLPEETELRRFEPIEVLIGSFHVEGVIIKSPMATLHNLLLITKEIHLPVYRATIRHVARPWLGEFAAGTIQVRLDRLTIMRSEPSPKSGG